ncbi:MAG: type II secretion system protein [Oscillospiraceae bacterium]
MGGLNTVKLGKKGMTLVETVVTLSIFSIVLLVSGIMILSSGDIVNRNSIANAEKYIGDSICDLIEEQVKFATKLSITKPTEALNASDKKYETAFTVFDGKFMYSNSSSDYINLYGDDYYYNHTVQYTAICRSVTENDKTIELLNVTVKVFRPDNQVSPAYTATNEIRLMNMGLKNNFTADTAKGTVNPIISFSKENIMAGSADDPIVNELMIRTDLMMDEYDMWQRRYVTSSDKQQVLSGFLKSFYIISNPSINRYMSRDDYANYINKHLGAKWPQFDNELLAPLKNYDLKYYDFLVKQNLTVRPYYDDISSNHHIVTQFYYAFPSNWESYLIYNMRDQHWYFYYEPDSGMWKRPYKQFDVAFMNSNDKSVDWLYDQLEDPKSNWHVLEKK